MQSQCKGYTNPVPGACTSDTHLPHKASSLQCGAAAGVGKSQASSMGNTPELVGKCYKTSMRT